MQGVGFFGGLRYNGDSDFFFLFQSVIKGGCIMYNCAKCFQRGCTKQDMTKTLPECPSKDTAVQEQAKELYRDPENYRIAYCAALTEAGGYCKDTRMIEIIKFLHRAGYKKIGLAFWNITVLRSSRSSAKTARFPRIFWASPTLRRCAETAKPSRCATPSGRRCCSTNRRPSLT